MTHIVAGLPELRALLAEEIASRPELKAREQRGLLTFRCPLPSHDDGTASAMLGEYAWNCKGCKGQGNGRLVELAAALGVDVKLAGGRGYTVDDYALEKGLPAHRLESWGLVTEPHPEFGTNRVMIPYYGLDGVVMRRRMRVQKRTGKERQFWEGQGGAIPGLYGLWMLAKVSPDTPVVLCEGESDTHALWCAGILAMGLPGSDTWGNCRWALPQLKDREVYVWEEPDEGGAILLRAIAADLPDARVIRGAAAGAKDPCALRQQDTDGFKDRMQALMQAAERIGTPSPPFAFDSLVGATLDRMAEERERPIDAVPTPWAAWNAACEQEGGEVGHAHGWYVLIGGAQGGRKSMLAQNCIASAFMAGEKVCVINGEMGQGQTTSRVMPIICDVPASELGYGHKFNRSTWERAAERMAILMEQTGGDIKVNRELLRTVGDVESCIDYYYEYHGFRTFVVDYLQLLWIMSGGVEKKVHEMSVVASQMLFRKAKQLKVLIYGLSQLTNEAAKKQETPQSQDVYGGMQMAADPDQIIIPDHSRTRPVVEQINLHGNTSPYSTGDTDGVAVLKKNRHGPSIEIPFRFHRRNLRMNQRALTAGDKW